MVVRKHDGEDKEHQEYIKPLVNSLVIDGSGCSLKHAGIDEDDESIDKCQVIVFLPYNVIGEHHPSFKHEGEKNEQAQFLESEDIRDDAYRK